MSDKIMKACGGSADCGAAAIVALVRALWQIHYSRPSPPSSDPSVFPPPDEQVLRKHLHAIGSSQGIQAALEVFLDMCRQGVARDFFNPVRCAAQLLPGTRSPADWHYLVSRQIRRAAGLRPSPETVHQFYSLGRALDKALGQNHADHLSYKSLIQILNQHKYAETSDFLVLGFALLGWVHPLPDAKNVRFDVRWLLAESLLSSLFGLTTSIRGFDDMFGGGILLPDAPHTLNTSLELSEDSGIGGRTVLVIGPFGSGKSLLSLQIAVEVARKGGVAWVMTLEQSFSECRYALEAIGVPVVNTAFDVIDTYPTAVKALSVSSGKGALIFLRPTRERYDDFLQSLGDNLPWMAQYPLRLFVIDPVNAFSRPRLAGKLREKTVELFERAKSQHVNLWLTCEQPGTGNNEGRFEENIADTVIHVGVEQDVDGTHRRRYIEVTKSRLQREQPGKHSLFIVSGGGTRIYPAPEAIQRTLASLRSERPNGFVQTNIPGLDDILGGHEALNAGDLIAFCGPTGTSKTITGLRFLFGPSSAESAKRTSLLIADASASGANAMIELGHQNAPGCDKDIASCLITPGYIAPGQLLQRVRSYLERYQCEGAPVDRALITNISRWELGMPLVKTEPVFCMTLLELLRRYNVTAVILCGADESPATRLIQENVDCAVEFSRLEFRGQNRNVIRVIKTRRMKHRREFFELVASDKGIHVKPTVSLLRRDADGNVHPVKISLFLHSETANHHIYNQRILGAVQTSLSVTADLQQQNRKYDSAVLSLGANSAVDELQILQLDEFQLPPEQMPGPSPLFEFPDSKQTQHLLSDRLGRFGEAARRGNAYIAFPFYENISLLAYRKSEFGVSGPVDWVDLARRCREWEYSNPGEDEIYFACQVSQADRFESYNCLFLEILAFWHPHESGEEIELIDWLSQPHAVDAARVFRTLLSRCHRRNFTLHSDLVGEPDHTHQFQLNSTAKVWRHWYNTLNQMLSMMPDRQDIKVRPLFGELTTSGEWYLGIPAYSAAPEVGLEVIDFLTTAAREVQRRHLGVGLPTRKRFYEGSDQSTYISPYFSLDPAILGQLVQNAFRRSRVRGYQVVAETMAAHLQRLLEGDPEADVAQALGGLISDLKNVRCRGEETK